MKKLLLITLLLAGGARANISPYAGTWDGTGNDNGEKPHIRAIIKPDGTGHFEESFVAPYKATGRITIANDGKFWMDNLNDNYGDGNNFSNEASEVSYATGYALINSEGHLIIEQGDEHDSTGKVIGHFTWDVALTDH